MRPHGHEATARLASGAGCVARVDHASAAAGPVGAAAAVCACDAVRLIKKD